MITVNSGQITDLAADITDLQADISLLENTDLTNITANLSTIKIMIASNTDQIGYLEGDIANL
jgi:hypothetical protein